MKLFATVVLGVAIGVGIAVVVAARQQESITSAVVPPAPQQVP